MTSDELFIMMDVDTWHPIRSLKETLALIDSARVHIMWQASQMGGEVVEWKQWKVDEDFRVLPFTRVAGKVIIEPTYESYDA